MKNISFVGAIASCALLAACQGSVSDVQVEDGMQASSSEAMMMDESSSSVEAMMDESSSSVEAMDAESSSSVEAMEAASSSVEAAM